MKIKILIIGIIICLIFLSGCGTTSSFSTNDKVICAEQCLANGLQLQGVATNVDYIYCYCEKIIRVKT